MLRELHAWVLDLQGDDDFVAVDLIYRITHLEILVAVLRTLELLHPHAFDAETAALAELGEAFPQDPVD